MGTMPEHEQVVNYFSAVTPNCNDCYRPNIATAVTLSLEDGSDYLGETLLPTSIEPILPDNRSTIEENETYMSEINEWQTKSVRLWNPHDIVNWINNEAKNLKICCTEMAGEKFALYDGRQLLALNKSQFIDIDRTYGQRLYQSFQEIAKTNSTQYHELNNARSIKFETNTSMEDEIHPSLILGTLYMEEDYKSTAIKEENEKIEIEEKPASPKPLPKKKGPGRPLGSKKKKKPERLGRLWEFLRDLLKNREYCPSLIVWDNYEEGMFRFVHSDKVAKLWGRKKENPDMNYEKLSRAMRYYYKSKVLQPVYGRRLVYKFGPTATGWRVDNPNFKN